MEETNLGLSNNVKDKEDINMSNTVQSDITVKQIIKILNSKKEIFIKPSGNGMYYEGTADGVPDDFLNLKVLEIAPRICYDRDLFNPYYTSMGLWVERAEWLDKRIKESGMVLSENINKILGENKKKNIVISGVAGAGKTEECKRRVKDLLDDINNRVIIYCVDNNYDDLEEKSYCGLVIKKQEEFKNIIEFFSWVSNDYIDNCMWKYNYKVFVDCYCQDGVNIIDLINWIRRFNDLGISVCLVVNEYEEIFCGADKEKFSKLIKWLSDKFSELKISGTST